MFGESPDGNILEWAVVEVIEPHRKVLSCEKTGQGFLQQMTQISFNFNLTSIVIVHLKLRRRHPGERLTGMDKI